MTEQTEPDAAMAEADFDDSINSTKNSDSNSDDNMEESATSKQPQYSNHDLDLKPDSNNSNLEKMENVDSKKGSIDLNSVSNLKEESSVKYGLRNLKQESGEQGHNLNAKIGVRDDDMNMFASVWVKVEVEEEGGVQPDDLTDVNYVPPSERKHRPRRRRDKKPRPRPTKVLKCQLCNYTTVYKTGLVMHMIGHTTEKPHCCTECDYKSKYRNSLTRHVKIQHQKDDTPETESVEVFTCDQCNYKTHFKWNLRAHNRKHNLVKQFKCVHCEYETAYRHNYLKHSRTHENKEKTPVFYKCDKCTFVTKFEGHIARHLAKIHNEVTDTAYKCEMCDFSTRVRWRLNIHRTRSRQENILMCAYCSFQTYFMCESKKHKVVHYDVMYGHKSHDISSESVHNSQIDATTGLPTTNETKDKRSAISNEYIDNYMDQDSMRNQKKYLLDPNCIDWNNIQVLESDDKDRPFQCHMCTYMSRFKASVQRHFQRHHTGSQNRPYKCVNCDFSTKTKDQIALHNKRSKSDVNLYCAVCKFTTNFKCQYVMHQKRHYENRCSECEYSCKHKYELQKHYMAIHMGNGHKCQYCDYIAARKESLLCHETIHTGIKPYKCSHCEYMSVRRSLLNNHVRRYHSNLLTDVVVVSDSKIASLKHVGSIDEVNQEVDYA
ncbi:zinc finger protein 761-like [Plodia interpunctella]|uniref:zinc finger protein 761-like n=1 Tax=Plodia interpunctella TaxID=58824 RepID=UPI0023685904|nr:zinc finger protein 761-like [Plodia interpunctella]XP_053621827.1 zinc finger protein 761-like [Plodia interpunctella]XP_053621828.1 zinc finger protein 761-like [Plodia interpunctella]